MLDIYRLGKTRSAQRTNYILQTPDTFVRAPLPGMRDVMAIVHVGPAAGARFTLYTAEFGNAGILEPACDPGVQRFIYVVQGELHTRDRGLVAGDFAYFPGNTDSTVSSEHAARAIVIEKRYQALANVAAPEFFNGREDSVAAQPLMGDETLEVRALVPSEPSFDFAVNTMTFQPGATLPMVEMHVMEHGLLMLAGGGIYRLGDDWYPVTEGDFIWMAPFCPQWFGALGKTPAKYLIYKDWNR